MNGLTPRQQQVLDFLGSCGQTPSYDEIAAHIGVASRGNIQRILASLEARGRIKRIPGRARSITLVGTDLSSVSTEALEAELARRAI